MTCKTSNAHTGAHLGRVCLLQATEEEIEVERALQKNTRTAVQKIWGSTLIHKEDLPFSVKQ